MLDKETAIQYLDHEFKAEELKKLSLKDITDLVMDAKICVCDTCKHITAHFTCNNTNFMGGGVLNYTHCAGFGFNKK